MKMHVEDCQLKTPTPPVCNGIFVIRRLVVCGYDQIFLVGGLPAIGESRVLCLTQSGEWRGPLTCKGEGESSNPRIAEYKYLGYVGTPEN